MIKTKFIRKFMRIAREVGEYENPCHSRKIGVVIVDPENNRILGTGYNGPPPGTPHCDSPEYLSNFFWPQLNESERESICTTHGTPDDPTGKDNFIKMYGYCGQCPRRLVGARSGQRTELCSCGHAERHAITNAGCVMRGCVMFCWCCIPCIQCSDSIIQAGISDIYCLREAAYHDVSRWLLEQGGVNIHEFDKEMFE